MNRKTYRFTKGDEKLIEKLIDDDQVMINHITLSSGEELPEHNADSNAYLVIVRGRMNLALEGEAEVHNQGVIANVDPGTRMHISNPFEDVLEFFVVKAPSPRIM